MRRNFIFITLWILLFLFLAGDAVTYLGQYRLQKNIEAAVKLPIGRSNPSQETIESIQQKEHQQLEQGLQSLVEIFFLVGIGSAYVFKTTKFQPQQQLPKTC